MKRREFLETAAAAALPRLAGQSPASEWGMPVFDLHFHLRPQTASNLAHLDGVGITKANLLTRGDALEGVKALEAAAPGRFTWFHSYDVAKPDLEQVLTRAVKDGAQGFGEMKFHVAADGPELRRAYALKANPKTTFIGHADAFWANLSADYHDEAAYPTGPIKRGGVTDRWLGEFPNLFGDLSANSGNNGLSRDPEFTADFLKRHQDKLLFGSDCSCSDGRGSGVSQSNNPAAARMAGKCVARETLGLLKAQASPDVRQKIVWGNVHRLLRIPPLAG